jgi:hypothetical protein
LLQAVDTFDRDQSLVLSRSVIRHRGPNADRRRKYLILLIPMGSRHRAHSHFAILSATAFAALAMLWTVMPETN